MGFDTGPFMLNVPFIIMKGSGFSNNRTGPAKGENIFKHFQVNR